MAPLPQLKGEASRDAYVARVDGGAEIHPNEAIFPLLSQGTDGRFQFIGTGFFVAQGAVFLTAAHVVEDVSPAHSFGSLQFLPDGTYQFRSVHVAARNTGSDLAVGYLNPLQHRETGDPFPNRVVTLSAATPKRSDKVVTFAYPKSRVIHGPPHHLDFEPTYFAGEVTDHWPNGRDAVLLPGDCFQTTMVLHGGASGGPVFGPDGAVFGVNSTGYANEEISFVSSVWGALDLPIPGMCFGVDAHPQTTSLRELINLGLVNVK